MTDQYTSLTPAALREIIEKLDEGLRRFEHQPVLTEPEAKIRRMMRDLREMLAERLGRDTGTH